MAGEGAEPSTKAELLDTGTPPFAMKFPAFLQRLASILLFVFASSLQGSGSLDDPSLVASAWHDNHGAN